MIRSYKLDFCNLEVHHNYMIAVMKEGIEKSQTAFEKSFFKKEFRQFDDVASALLWKDTLIKNHQENIVLPNKKQKKRIK